MDLDSIRVDVGLLDKLMNLVGELVLARNQILQFTSTQGDLTFTGATQRLNLVTSELQGSVMKTRAADWQCLEQVPEGRTSRSAFHRWRASAGWRFTRKIVSSWSRSPPRRRPSPIDLRNPPFGWRGGKKSGPKTTSQSTILVALYATVVAVSI